MEKRQKKTHKFDAGFEPERQEKKESNDTLRLTKLPVEQFGVFFLRRLTRRILQAKPKNSPSVPPFGRLRLLRESVVGERTAGERENKKSTPIGMLSVELLQQF